MGNCYGKTPKDGHKHQHNDQRERRNTRTADTSQTKKASKYKKRKKNDSQTVAVQHTEELCDWQKRLQEETRKHQDTKTRLNETQVELQKITEENKRLQGNFRATDEHCRRKLAEKEREMSRQRDEIQCLEKKNAEILTRLSAIASAKLTDGNANIADLSDGNRPTKLGEQFSELYDNEWTDAYAHLTKDNKRTEEEACKVLLSILCQTYTKCKDLSIQEMNNLIDAYKAFSAGQVPPSEILKMLKDIRKKKPKDSSTIIKETNLDLTLCKLLPEEQDRMEIKVFFEKCLPLCWLMVVQDPPVYIDTESLIVNKCFDVNTFKPYTKSGEFVDFVVWPALYLCKGGGILTKGVAQGNTNQKPESPRKDIPGVAQGNANQMPMSPRKDIPGVARGNANQMTVSPRMDIPEEAQCNSNQKLESPRKDIPGVAQGNANQIPVSPRKDIPGVAQGNANQIPVSPRKGIPGVAQGNANQMPVSPRKDIPGVAQGKTNQMPVSPRKDIPGDAQGNANQMSVSPRKDIPGVAQGNSNQKPVSPRKDIPGVAQGNTNQMPVSPRKEISGVAQGNANQISVFPRKDIPENSISYSGKQASHLLDESRNMGGARTPGLNSDNCTTVIKNSTNQANEKIPEKEASASDRKKVEDQDSSTRGRDSYSVPKQLEFGDINAKKSKAMPHKTSINIATAPASKYKK